MLSVQISTVIFHYSTKYSIDTIDPVLHNVRTNFAIKAERVRSCVINATF
jgi:hypothetical protein